MGVEEYIAKTLLMCYMSLKKFLKNVYLSLACDDRDVYEGSKDLGPISR
jgi:hypothetical protein